MKILLRCVFVIFASSIIATSCEKDPFLTLITPKTIYFTNQGGTKSLDFTSNRSWAISSSDSWCTISPTSGYKAEGNNNVILNCHQNTTYDSRSATITIKAGELSETITVVQETNLGIIVSPTLFDLTNEAQSIEVEVQSNVKYTVEIDADCKEWIVQNNTKTLTTDIINFSIAANKSYDTREGIIHFIQDNGTTSDIHIVQKQQDALFISGNKNNITMSYNNQMQEITICTNINYHISIDSDWITPISTKGLQDSIVTFSIDENPSYEKRIANVSIKSDNGLYNRNIQFIQRGKPIDLSYMGTSNCYIVPLRDSTFSFSLTIDGNNYYNINKGALVDIVWEAPANQYYSESLFEDVNYEPQNNRIVFNTKKIEGNAVIALVDDNDNILWSWHLWLTNYDPNTDFITFSNGVVLQDRYLGASSEESIGLYYQWGRKDPFSPKKYVSILPDESTGSVTYSISYPNHFLCASYNFTEWDWNYEHTAVWSSNKTIHDPCPHGWKVMDGNPFCIPAIPDNYQIEYDNHCFILSEPTCFPSTKFRMTGLLHSTGDIQGTTSHVSVWSNYGFYGWFYVGRRLSITKKIDGYRIEYDESGRAYGHNIRCQRDI